ncbi:MAG: hypothetical protein M1839_004586 [Geoglossum umbratile]|nr:MAG: hypothetical protein M1839_004586 [Geoglossum umbratile]
MATKATSEPSRCYKPLATRAPVLFTFVFLNLLLIFLVEVSFHKLPSMKAPGLFDKTISLPVATATSATTVITGGAIVAFATVTDKERRAPVPTLAHPFTHPSDDPHNHPHCGTYGNPCGNSARAPEAENERRAPTLKTSVDDPHSHPHCGTYGNPCGHGAKERRAPATEGVSEIRHRSSDEPEQIPASYWTIPNRIYFLGNYFPVITAIILCLLWSITLTAIKTMEPFYQLAQPSGATGARSLNLRSAAPSWVVVYHALLQRQWVVVLGGLVGFLFMVLVPLASEMIAIDTHSDCIDIAEDMQHCFAKLGVSVLVGRVIQGLLAVTAVLTLAIAILSWNRWSGVFADPSSIAGLATLFRDEEVVDEFRKLRPDSSRTVVAKKLAGKRWRLGYFKNPDGCVGYGFTMCKGAEKDVLEHDTKAEWDKSSVMTDSSIGAESSSRRVSGPGSPWLHYASITLIALVFAGLLSMILYYQQTESDSGFERFMDSQGFGVSFLMTSIGVLIKSYWTAVEKETRTVEPYRVLSQRYAHPRDTILVCSKFSPITALTTSVFRLRHHLSILALNAILSEVLTVALSRIPFHGDSIYLAYVVSSRLSTGIISFMIVTLIWVAVRQRQSHGLELLPQRPDSIAAVLTYLCGSRMLGDFQGLAVVGEKERDEMVINMGKKYWLGKVVGVDGVERVGINEEDSWKVQG